jgi:predicted nucleotidyltransferase component of viral defense system
MLNQSKHRVAMFRLLTDILRDPYLSSSLGFKGGTACYFFYALPRFSVDLDFDIMPSAGKDAPTLVYEKLERIIKGCGLEIRDKNLKFNTVYFMASYSQDDHNIKLEISKRNFPNKYDKLEFYGMPINVLSKADIFAHKLVAATDRGRTAMRDFFDIYFFFKEAWPVNEEIVRLRTKISLEQYLGKLKSYIEEHMTSRNVLQGLGELIGPEQKTWAKNQLKTELLRIIDFYIDTISK